MKRQMKHDWTAVGASTALDGLDAVEAELPDVRSMPDDVECVHRIRVASRRLRSALGIFEPFLGKRSRKWRRDARWVTKVFGRARDLDVQIELLRDYLKRQDDPAGRFGPEVLLDHLAREREKAQESIVESLNKLESTGIIETMREELQGVRAEAPAGTARVVPLEHRWVREAIRERLRELLRYSRYVRRPECVKELHEMRIAAKRLRYTLDAFLPYQRRDLAAAASLGKKLQDLLGDIHDCDVWVNFLAQFGRKRRLWGPSVGAEKADRERFKDGLSRLRGERQRRRNKLYKRLVKLWGAIEKDGAWKRLRRQLRRA